MRACESWSDLAFCFAQGFTPGHIDRCSFSSSELASVMPPVFNLNQTALDPSFPVTSLSQLCHSVDAASAAVIFSQLSCKRGSLEWAHFGKLKFSAALFLQLTTRRSPSTRTKSSPGSRWSTKAGGEATVRTDTLECSPPITLSLSRPQPPPSTTDLHPCSPGWGALC